MIWIRSHTPTCVFQIAVMKDERQKAVILIQWAILKPGVAPAHHWDGSSACKAPLKWKLLPAKMTLPYTPECLMGRFISHYTRLAPLLRWKQLPSCLCTFGQISLAWLRTFGAPLAVVWCCSTPASHCLRRSVAPLLSVLPFVFLLCLFGERLPQNNRLAAITPSVIRRAVRVHLEVRRWFRGRLGRQLGWCSGQVCCF